MIVYLFLLKSVLGKKNTNKYVLFLFLIIIYF